ncbi:hypothetical protein AB0C51_01670 [Streptomyces pathocidini]|uniref:hypothetical protein n=1 Tax=Streptomyces pathocidini TaxID=1650571 RepID=UPI003404DDE5
MSADTHVPVRAEGPRSAVPLRPLWGTRVRGALRRAAPALGLYAALRLGGLLTLALWSWHAGREPHRLLGRSWDSAWYLRLAAHGYGHVVHGADPAYVYSDAAFFPLYPALIRAVRTLTPLDYTDSALLVSWAAAGLAAWGIYAVGERLHGRRAATLLVVVWGALPHAIVQSMAYTESLLTAFAAWALYGVLTGRWIWAGALAVLAGLSRPNGVAVAAAVVLGAAWQICQLWRHRAPDSLSLRARQDWRLWAGAALAPLGWAGYVGWVGLRRGAPLTGYFEVQRRWGSKFDFGEDAWESVRAMVLGKEHLTYAMSTAIVLLAVVLLALLALDRPPLALLAYSTLLLVIAAGGSRYFGCKPRFLLPAFPLLLPVAAGMARARQRTAVVMVGALAGLSWAYGTYLLAISVSAP